MSIDNTKITNNANKNIIYGCNFPTDPNILPTKPPIPIPDIDPHTTPPRGSHLLSIDTFFLLFIYLNKNESDRDKLQWINEMTNV